MTEELKPCPFCGSDRTRHENDGDFLWIECGMCMARGPIVRARVGDALLKVDSTWSLRAAPSQPEGAEPVAWPPYVYGRECGQNEKVWTEQAVQQLINQLRASQSAGAAAPDEGKAWRPIETAPKDGTEVLAWEPGIGRMVLFFNVSKEAPEGVWIDGLSGEDFHPSLWWPVLPSAPKGEDS